MPVPTTRLRGTRTGRAPAQPGSVASLRRVLPAVLWIGVAAVAALAPTGAVRAQAPLLIGTYTADGALYDYNISVITPSSSPVGFFLTDTTIPLGSLIEDETAPAGFQIQDSLVTDPTLGTTTQLLSFLPGLGSSQEFSPGTTVGSFFFKSDAFLNGAPYDVTDDNGNDGTTISAYNGNLVLTQASAPEPSDAALLLGAGLPGALLLRMRSRRRRLAAASI